MKPTNKVYPWWCYAVALVALLLVYPITAAFLLNECRKDQYFLDAEGSMTKAVLELAAGLVGWFCLVAIVIALVWRLPNGY